MRHARALIAIALVLLGASSCGRTAGSPPHGGAAPDSNSSTTVATTDTPVGTTGLPSPPPTVETTDTRVDPTVRVPNVLEKSSRSPAPAPASARQADIRGSITQITGNQVRIEATPDEFRGDKAVVTVTESTIIRDQAGNVLSLRDLRKGQTVRVWFGEEVMKSYPLQATASSVVVESP